MHAGLHITNKNKRHLNSILIINNSSNYLTVLLQKVIRKINDFFLLEKRKMTASEYQLTIKSICY